MNHHDAFLSAIIARPEDDLPRLVYADYLDETGDPDRAEFIRVQCELARRGPSDPTRAGLQARSEQLLRANRQRWVVPGLRGVQSFRRGFVEAVRTSAESLLAAAGALFRTTPVRELRVQNADHSFDALARLPGLDRIESLDLTNNFQGLNARLGWFLSTAPLGSLRRLTVRNAQLWADSIADLVRTPVARKLEALNLSGNPIADAGTELLASAPLGALQRLTVRNDMVRYDDSVHAGGAGALARSRSIRLRSLDLRGQYVGDAGLIALVTSPNAAGLANLDLADNEIGMTGEAGFEALAASPYLGSLERLSLARNQVGFRSAQALAAWPRVEAGLQVDLSGCSFERGARELLLQSPAAGRFVIDPPDDLAPETDA
jgi:uncharacterized protein (TIGR02996 family)